MLRGQKFIKEVYDALTANEKTWHETLLIITYDEHGGLYDHVVPPLAEVITKGRPVRSWGTGELGSSAGGTSPTVHDHRTQGVVRNSTVGSWLGPIGPLPVQPVGPAPVQPVGPLPVQPPVSPSPPAQPTELRIPYGVRVPTFVVSPWSMPGKGPSITLDHCSILKTVLARFTGADKPFLSERVHASNSFESYLTAAQPRPAPASPPIPNLPVEARRLVPGASQISTPPVSSQKMREGGVDYHDLSGWVARLLGR
jgi:phospholipase C